MIARVAPHPATAAPKAAALRSAGGPSRPLLSVGLDLDNHWAYLKTHGDPGWESFPSYLDPLMEVVLGRLRGHGLTLTAFVVGQDAALEKNRTALRRLADAGHEIANHSFHHEPWFHLYSRPQIADEIARADAAIESATGRRPRGFRGPGFSLSPDTLRVLAARNYLYDATTFPTYLGPLARAYYFWKSGEMSEEERHKRNRLFGKARDGLQPLRPYTWEVDGRRLVEVPVTTMPITRLPFHMSYLLYLGKHSQALGHAYLRAALSLCRGFGLEPSFLLHPLDFLGCDRVKELAFFPGMDLATGPKLRFFDSVIELLKRRFTLVTVGQHAQAVFAAGGGKVRHPEGR